MAEKITWIDKKSVLYHSKRMFKAGDVIPAGIIPSSRIETLKKEKKIAIGETKVDNSVKTVKLFDNEIEAKVIQHEAPVQFEEKSKRGRKSKAELEEEELQRMIDEESGM
jgi:hypothetical protein